MKRWIRAFDNAVLGGTALRTFHRIQERSLRSRIVSTPRFDYAMDIRYGRDVTHHLADLCDRYGSDKGSRYEKGPHVYPWPPHSYAHFYAMLFDHCRQHVRRVFECGLGTTDPTIPASMFESGKPGASMRVWRDYFPNAEIVGADIDRSVLFQEDRIRTFYVDQLDPDAIRAMWDAVGGAPFDLMVDDGLHTFEGGSTLFEHSHHRLAPGGLYIIEDVKPTDAQRYQRFFATTWWDVSIVMLTRPGLPLGDNSLIVIRKESRVA